MKRFVPCPRTVVRTLLFILTLSALCLPAAAQTDSGELWDQLAKPVFSTAGVAAVDNVRLRRDVIDLEFLSGRLALADAVVESEENGERVFAAAF